jgi:pimeloyl-ACP methyl ester carboxylesterase
VDVVKARHPGLPVYVLGESMGGAVAMTALASDEPPKADGLILVSPAVWSRRTMPISYRLALWVTSRSFRWWALSGSGLKIMPSDNIPMLIAIGRDPLFQKRARADAWSLLCRLDKDHSRTRALLAGSPDVASSTDPTMLALRESALELKSVPATGEQLDWLLELRKPERSKFFGAAKDAIAGLNDEQIAGLELRHASGVIWAAANSPEWLRMNRAALLAEVSKRIDPQKHHRRTADTAEGAPMPKESIAAFDAKLVWGDALLLLISTEALRDSGAVAE